MSRVVHYYPAMLSGDHGSCLAARGWAEAQALAGLEVTVVTEEALDTDEPTNVEHLHARHGVIFGRGLIPTNFSGVLEQTAPHVVVLHGGWVPYNAIVAATLRKARIPYIVMAHGAYHPRIQKRQLMKAAWWAVMERRLLQGAAGLQFHFEDEILKACPPIPRLLLPNGVRRVPEESRWRGGNDYMLWLGRFSILQKGLDRLLEALTVLPPSARPNIRMHGPDAGGDKKRFAEAVRSKGLEPWVKINDPIYGVEKREALRGCRAFLYPSRWEGSPIAVAEALGCGAPTITGDFGLAWFLNARGATLQASDSKTLAHNLALEANSILTDISMRASEVVDAELNWDVLARQWTAFAESVTFRPSGEQAF